MSLASHNPEKWEEACVAAIAYHIHSKTYKEWRDGSEQNHIENIEYAVAQLSASSRLTDTGPGDQAIFEVLMDLPGVGSDALDRFHEMFR